MNKPEVIDLASQLEGRCRRRSKNDPLAPK